MNSSPTLSVVMHVHPEHADLSKTLIQLNNELPENTEIFLTGPLASEVVPPFAQWLSDTQTLSPFAAFNEGAQHAKGDLLFFLQGDFELEPGWAAPLLLAMEKEDIGMVGPLLLPRQTPEASSTFEEPLAGLTYIDAAMNTCWLTPGNTANLVPVITGPLVALRKTMFNTLGGFDTGFHDNGFQYHDLSMRIWRMGKQCVIEPSSKVSYLLPTYTTEGEAWASYLQDLIRLACIHLEPAELDVFLSTLQDSDTLNSTREPLKADLAERKARIDACAVESASAVIRRLCGSIFNLGDTSDLSSLPGGEEDRYAEVNRKAWAHWAHTGTHASTPVSPEELAEARVHLDPFNWLPWNKFKTVLCLGAGGGKQAPLFASLGFETTLLDISPEQLALDRQVAEKNSLRLEILEANMQDLTILGDRTFDLIYQPVSSCYIPDVSALYQQVSEHLSPEGLYLSEHWNPVQIQMEEHGRWDGKGYRLVHPQDTHRAVPWKIPGAFDGGMPIVTWHYIHPLDDLIGGLIRAGLSILQFAENGSGNAEAKPGSEAHIASFAPNFLWILAEKRCG